MAISGPPRTCSEGAGHKDYPSLGFGFYSTRLEDAERPGLVEKGDCADRPATSGGGRVSGLRHIQSRRKSCACRRGCNCWASPTLQLLKRLESKVDC